MACGDGSRGCIGAADSTVDSSPWDGAPEGFRSLSKAVDIQIEPFASMVTGDFTGDGIQDSAFWYSPATIVEGPLPAYLNLAEQSTWTANIPFLDASWDSYGLASGDQGGDGVDDLAVSAYVREQSEFYVFLYDGPILEDRPLSVESADGAVVDDGVFATGSELSMGDVNDDGRDDILIGAPDAIGPDISPGCAYLVLGPVSGTMSLGDADTEFEGVEEAEGTGTLLSLRGDLNADGIGDVLIAAVDTNGGGLYLFYGPPPDGSISVADGDAVLLGSPMNEANRLSVGDNDGDGHDDVMVSDGCGYGACSGAIWVFRGPLSNSFSVEDATATVYHDYGSSYFGNGASMDHDLDGDGRADLAGGATHDRSSEEWIGGVYIFYGPISGSLWTDDADAVIKGSRSGGEPHTGPGAYISSAGDANGDGFDDLLFTGRDSELGDGSFIVFGGER